MRYRNKRTGAIIDSPSKIQGGNWIEVEEIDEDIMDDIDKDDTITLSKMTVAALKEFADEHGIDLGKATRREEIIKVIMESEEVEIE